MQKGSELKYLIALKAIPMVGDILARRLLAAFSSAENIFRISVSDMLKMPGVGKNIADHIHGNKDKALALAEKELEYVEKENIKTVHFYEQNYPERLKHCIDAPLYLFYKGDFKLNAKHVISVVGTRSSTVYGRNMCSKLIKNLKLSDLQIVSGMAYGIDTAAHQAAVEESIPTIAVLGHGFNHLYPPENKALSEKIIQNGALLTEFLSFEKPDREHFPIRNRIIAGLSDATIVVEARSKGGALITAEIANSYNRDVFSVPGKVGDRNSKGCNWLIRTNRAMLLESAEQFKYYMNWESEEKPQKQTVMNMVLDPKTQEVFDFLKDNNECDIDKICRTLNLSMNNAATILLDLEFQGLINSLPGKRYCLKI
ncbi:MAG: DNA-protecting protein DprA [Marinilabiliales bacterium]|nr:MAG: DNA-protecting protein DprA [Marinilabiliales bacterium]